MDDHFLASANFAEHPWRHAERDPDRPAVRCGGDTWSYGRLRDAIARFAGAVRRRGVAPGARAILIAPTVPEFVVAYFGLQAAGVVVIAMNPMATSFEIGYVLEDAECSLVVAWHECADGGRAAVSGWEAEAWILTPGLATLEKATPLSRPVEVRGEDTALILYTSGTTGGPKGVQLTHRNLAAGGEAFTAALEVTSNDVFGTPLPLFHVFGGSVVMGTTLMNGATLALLPRFETATALGMIASGEVSIFAGVPTMYNAMLRDADEASDFSRLRFCCSGGASLPLEVLQAFSDRFGIVILEGYALTETTGAATFNGLHRRRKPGFVGVPLPGTQVRILDDSGYELGVEEVGEVVIRGPQVMNGYYGRPEATAESLRDGWLHTGDLGMKDEDGDLRIVDRKKDLIIRGGYNVYPQEVEQVLYGHPDVIEAAVLGVEDPLLGEEIAAVVAVAPDAELDAESLSAWTRERLSAYKSPRLLKLVESLPKGSTGKILKRGIDVGDMVDLRKHGKLRRD